MHQDSHHQRIISALNFEARYACFYILFLLVISVPSFFQALLFQFHLVILIALGLDSLQEQIKTRGIKSHL